METPPNTTPAPKPLEIPVTETKLDTLYRIAPKLASGGATPEEISFYNQNRLPGWEPAESWRQGNDTPAADPKPNDPTPNDPAPNPAPTEFNVQRYDPKSLAVAADEHSDRIVSTIIGLCEKIEAHAGEVFESERRRLLDAGISPDEAAATAKRLGEASQNEKRKEVFAANEKAIMAEIAVLQQRETEARQYANVYDCINAPSSLNLCDAHDLGSAKRSALMQQLEGIGPASIKGMAALAMQTGDKTLTACLKNLNDRLPKSDRLISSLDLADKLFGEQARAIHQSYVVTRTAVQSAISFLRQLQSGRVDSLAKIERGIARHRAKIANKAIAEAKPSDSIAADNALSKIRAGLNNGLAARA